MTAPTCPRCAQLEAERDTLRRALDEARGQVRTLRLTLDQQVDIAAELEGSLNSALDERDAAREQLAALRVALRAYDDARAAYVEGWGTATACETEEERAFFEAAQRVAALIKETE